MVNTPTLDKKSTDNQSRISSIEEKKFGLPLPKRVLFGYLLVGALLISPLFFKGHYLNPVTISIHVICYGFWACTINLLNREMQEIDKFFPFGPNESTVGALVPFSYIFWNFHWVSEICKNIGGRFDRKKSYLIGLAASAASLACFPDNMDKISSIVPILGFTVLFTITWLLTLNLREVSDNSNYSQSSTKES